MKRETLVYFEGQEREYEGTLSLDRKDRNELNQRAKNNGYVGYLSGYRWTYDSKSETVLVYFKEKPSVMEIDRRRNNGFKRAEWYWL